MSGGSERGSLGRCEWKEDRKRILFGIQKSRVGFKSQELDKIRLLQKSIDS